ncbi:unnamed protein product [Pedinophyceae sp. YPF-701]|nr:unnamed protein product [Pedinophyceae sp. YPF-701]
MSGKAVPWAGWAEWVQCRCWLFSETLDDRLRGLALVAAWRLKSRLAMAIDATAALVELGIRDRARDDGAHGGGAARDAHSLRLEYAMTIVRLVNGVADSQQRGKVAISVEGQAAAAGLPRVLVELRHMATHNELPGLPVLRLAAQHSMAWLATHYWGAQEAHLARSHCRLASAVDELFLFRRERARLRLRGQPDDDEETPPSAKKAKQSPGGARASDLTRGERQKHEQSLNAALKAAVPPHGAGVGSDLARVVLLSPRLRPPLAELRCARGGQSACRNSAEVATFRASCVEAEGWREAARALLRQWEALAATVLSAGVEALTGAADGAQIFADVHPWAPAAGRGGEGDSEAAGESGGGVCDAGCAPLDPRGIEEDAQAAVEWIRIAAEAVSQRTGHAAASAVDVSGLIAQCAAARADADAASPAHETWVQCLDDAIACVANLEAAKPKRGAGAQRARVLARLVELAAPPPAEAAATGCAKEGLAELASAYDAAAAAQRELLGGVRETPLGGCPDTGGAWEAVDGWRPCHVGEVPWARGRGAAGAPASDQLIDAAAARLKVRLLGGGSAVAGRTGGGAAEAAFADVAAVGRVAEHGRYGNHDCGGDGGDRAVEAEGGESGAAQAVPLGFLGLAAGSEELAALQQSLGVL